MFEADEMEGCHSCKYGDEFDTEKEPCKYCYGLSLYTKKEKLMEFRMKNRYETGEEFYQDIKKHLIEDGFVIAKSDETLAILSNEEDEWYCHYQTCSTCNTDFMCSKAKFCPGCGRKIVGSKRGNETVFYGKGDEDNENRTS